MEFEVVFLEIGVAEVALGGRGLVWERWKGNARAVSARGLKGTTYLVIYIDDCIVA